MSDFFKPELPSDTIYHVGVSGGKDSTAVLLWMLHKSGVPKNSLDVTFCDTGNEHEWTLQHVKLLSDKVHPIKTLKPKRGFYDLADHKRRFPSAKVRFCTQFLKIFPTQDHITELLKTGRKIVAVSGVRANESEDRSKLEEWDYSGELLTLQWRPLIRWTLADVIAIHKEFNVPLNTLYGMGAERVGCFPCIMSRKAEIRLAATVAPERIEMIRSREQALGALRGRYAPFFHHDKVPARYRTVPCRDADGVERMVASIDDVVRWSMTGKRAQGSWADEEQPEPITCRSGFCE